jgi:hypothetical protein
MNSLRVSAECGYLRGQVDRLQHEVDLLEIELLIFFGLLVVTVAALLMSLERNLRIVRPGTRTSTESELPSERGTNEELKALKRSNANRWYGLIAFWAAYNGGIYYMYVACAPDWRRVLFITLLLQSFVALAAFCALWKPRFRIQGRPFQDSA